MGRLRRSRGGRASEHERPRLALVPGSVIDQSEDPTYHLFDALPDGSCRACTNAPDDHLAWPNRIDAPTAERASFVVEQIDDGRWALMLNGLDVAHVRLAFAPDGALVTVAVAAVQPGPDGTARVWPAVGVDPSPWTGASALRVVVAGTSVVCGCGQRQRTRTRRAAVAAADQHRAEHETAGQAALVIIRP